MAAVERLRTAFPEQSIQALKWNAHYVAVPLEVAVELPSRGPIGGVDIRAREPIFLLLRQKRYPYSAPSAWSDRRDFPKTLPHLNPTDPGVAANFCLHRGSLDTWFAEHDIVDLVERVRSWLRDAARDRLVAREDSFEPTRPADTLGRVIFDPEEFLSGIREEWAYRAGTAGFRLVSYELLDEEADAVLGATSYSVRAGVTIVPIISEALWEFRDLSKAINALAGDDRYKKLVRKRLFGILAWPSSEVVTSAYFGELPGSLDELFLWTDKLGVSLREAMKFYLDGDFQRLAGIPITVAVRRPRPIIGANGDIELITFLVTAGGEHWPKDGEWDLGAKVRVCDHRTILSPAFARFISSHSRDIAFGKTLLLGCGALGSKVALHFARSGQTALTLVDFAKLAPHNVVRHAIGGRGAGAGKAEGLRDEIVELYPGQTAEALGVGAIGADAFDLLIGDRRSEVEGHAHLIDATASTPVFSMLIDAGLPVSARVTRIEIGDRGRLGLMSVEGVDRNPRLDDLQAMRFDSSLDEPAIERWLVGVREKRETEVGSGLEDVQIGLSCDSATMRLADETASLHAAAFAARLRKHMVPGPEEMDRDGALYSVVLDDGGVIRTSERRVKAFSIVRARNDARWQVRFAAGLMDQMLQALQRARPSETGGLMIGMVHAKRRVIYVTRLLDAPRDSEGSPTAFVRGIDDLPAGISEIERRTGGMLGYVGEWHSHPRGGPDLSPTDWVAALRLKSMLDRVPMPTHVTVVTPRGVHPHVFEAGADGLMLRGGRLRVVRLQ